MSMKEHIHAKIEAALAPTLLEVVDDSHRHVGHIGHPGSGHPGSTSAAETHFTIKVACEAFVGKSRIARHRLINALLAPELEGGVHALAIEARAPGE